MIEKLLRGVVLACSSEFAIEEESESLDRKLTSTYVKWGSSLIDLLALAFMIESTVWTKEL